jgi:hypothetical protein
MSAPKSYLRPVARPQDCTANTRRQNNSAKGILEQTKSEYCTCRQTARCITCLRWNRLITGIEQRQKSFGQKSFDRRALI